MLNVAVIRSNFLPSSETFIYSELVHLKKTKAIVCTKRTQNEREFPFGKIYKYKSDRELEKILKKRKIDLIHARFGMTGVQLLSLKKKLRLPMLTSFHGSDLPTNKRRKKSYRKALPELFKHGEVFTVPSKNMRDILIRHGCPRNKIHVHYSGIDVRKFTFPYRSFPVNGSVVILTVGRLVEKKGMKYVIHAFNRVQKVFPAVQLRIAGDGPLRGELKKLVRKYRIDDKVKFLGKISHQEVLREMQNAHLFVLASTKARKGNQEGIPNVLKEAMACGLPVVSTWHGGIPELIRHEQSGYLARERDAEDLAERLIKLLKHPERWHEMGRKGREMVTKSFNLEKQVRELESLYKRVVKMKKAGRQ